jgi:serine/threonine protein kinase/CheY-like chemotaxis protein
MTEIDAETLAEQAVLVGLLSRDQIRQAKADAEDGTVEALTRSLLRKGMITSWHRDKLLKGDLRGFFFGGYKVLFHIAEGTFARVYRGEQIDTGKPVAIKVLRRRFTTDPGAVARFAQEAEAGVELVHPNIVRIFESGEGDGGHYMAMEYVEGSNLRDFLKIRHRLGYEEALPIMLGLARGMSYAHEHGVTHRDIKGTNILISTRREAKLVDFGLAEVADDRMTEVAHTRTVDYSALERTCGTHKGDWRSDIYFLGCVFYQMLTGVLPFPEVETSDVLAKMLKRSFGAIKPISEMRYAPPVELCEIIEKMMKIELIKRYQMFSEVVADLEAFAGVSSPELVTGAAPEGRSSRAILELSDHELLASAFSLARPSAAARGGEAEPSPAPVAKPAPAPAPAASAPEAAPTPAVPRPEPPSLLCVEVQADVQAVFKKALTKLGYRVALVEDAVVAADRYRDSRPDAVVFDADGQGPEAFDAFLAMHESAHAEGHPLAALVILGPKQLDLSLQLPDDDRLIVLAKPIKMKDVQNALGLLVPVIN